MRVGLGLFLLGFCPWLGWVITGKPLDISITTGRSLSGMTCIVVRNTGQETLYDLTVTVSRVESPVGDYNIRPEAGKMAVLRPGESAIFDSVQYRPGAVVVIKAKGCREVTHHMP